MQNGKKGRRDDGEFTTDDCRTGFGWNSSCPGICEEGISGNLANGQTGGMEMEEADNRLVPSGVLNPGKWKGCSRLDNGRSSAC